MENPKTETTGRRAISNGNKLFLPVVESRARDSNKGEHRRFPTAAQKAQTGSFGTCNWRWGVNSTLEGFPEQVAQRVCWPHLLWPALDRGWIRDHQRSLPTSVSVILPTDCSMDQSINGSKHSFCKVVPQNSLRSFGGIAYHEGQSSWVDSLHLGFEKW